MYDKMHSEFPSMHMKNDIYATVRGCRSCAQDHRGSKIRKLCLFPPSEPLEYVAIDIHDL